MSYLRKAFLSIAIKLASAGVGFTVEMNNLIDFESVELILILVTAVVLIVTVYWNRFRRMFPYWLLIKSGFDFIYVLTLNETGFMTGLIIAANIVFIMIFVCEYLISKVLANEIYSKLASIIFVICFLLPYVAVFLSLTMVLLGVLFYEISIFVLIICLIVNACIFFKVCFVFVNLLLLTLNK